MKLLGFSIFFCIFLRNSSPKLSKSTEKIVRKSKEKDEKFYTTVAAVENESQSELGLAFNPLDTKA